MPKNGFLQKGIVIKKCSADLLENIENTPDVCVMEVHKGQAITEHKHGNSMYFARNVKALTIEGSAHTLPNFSWVFIPEGVSHGWMDVQDSAYTGKVFSYHQNHKKYSLISI